MKIERDAAEKKRDVKIARVSALVDSYLKAQDLKDPQAREAAFAVLRPLFEL